MVEIVPATHDVLFRHYREPLGQSVYAIAAVDGDKTLGVAGFYLTASGAVVFAELSDQLRAMPRVLIKGARRIFKALEDKRYNVFAKCDQNIEAAERFLLHLGFQRFDGDVFVWLPRSR